jgi:hypothetical protein
LLDELEIPLEDHNDSMSMYVYEVTAWLGIPHNRQLDEHSEVAGSRLTSPAAWRWRTPAYAALFRSRARR